MKQLPHSLLPGSSCFQLFVLSPLAEFVHDRSCLLKARTRLGVSKGVYSEREPSLDPTLPVRLSPEATRRAYTRSRYATHLPRTVR